MNATMVSLWASFLGVSNSVVDLSTKIVKRLDVSAFINPGVPIVTKLQFFTDRYERYSFFFILIIELRKCFTMFLTNKQKNKKGNNNNEKYVYVLCNMQYIYIYVI